MAWIGYLTINVNVITEMKLYKMACKKIEKLIYSLLNSKYYLCRLTFSLTATFLKKDVLGRLFLYLKNNE